MTDKSTRGTPNPYIRMAARVLPSHARTVEFLFATEQNKTMMLKTNSTHAVLKVNDILPDRNSLDEVVPTMSSILEEFSRIPARNLESAR